MTVTHLDSAAAVHAAPVMRGSAGPAQRDLVRRRAVIFSLTGATLALVAILLGAALAAGGWTLADTVLFAAVLLGAPWAILSMWNAALGLWLLHGRRDGLKTVAPFLAAGETSAPPTTRTALAMTLRNEAPERSYQRLAAMRRALDETGHGWNFDIHILSDTSDPAIAAVEERLFREMHHELGGQQAFYRRRAKNTAWKAGNVREFLSRRGRAYDFYLPLDSDSYMGAPTILRMVRIMEAYPRIGILQSLAMQKTADSLFTRAVSFASRLSASAVLTGASWWQGDTCFYWGHNALIRVEPFRRHCRLPVLPGEPPLGGYILSHDLPEAALMRRAGFECRVIPVETESWEENPPTIADFIRRDLRWCNGNMQAARLMMLRGLTPLSRFHLSTAAMMYFGGPAWMLMLAAVIWKLVIGEGGIDVALGMTVFFAMLTVALAPKVLGVIDVVLTPGRVRAFGGARRLAASLGVEFVMSTMMAPVVAFQQTVFMIGLAFGRRMSWSGQNRDSYRLGWLEAARGLWPQTLFGFGLFALALAAGGWVAVAWASPILLGLCLAVPFAVVTAWPELGAWSTRVGLCAVPDDFEPAEALRRLDVANALSMPTEPPMKVA